MIMNREELINAALEHQSKFETCDGEGTLVGFANGMHKQSYESFIAGAEWQAKQSPWHDTTEKPVQGKLCLVEYKDPNGEIRVRLDKHCGFEWKEMCHYDRILRWAYVDDLKPPTFDQVFETDKDVLQRIKEKGETE
ncbi:hypothetical protein DW989_04610 [Bacteroides stercoris]|nr:hypothetical protein DW989_04610 [Bacteroides stercoris]